ncbi:MAG: IPT/TIG domain-containing protein [Gemmatimonadota bacterium]|nr:IPT/TIG domain-containing protein [Gemmatimonadota bacterium]MDH3423630.1 IPT/TIG domain-containing protein [Gemmatimonadota bacterium]
MRPDRRRSPWWIGTLAGLLTTSCSPGSVAVLTGLEIVVAEGDGQFGTVGQLLGTPLRVVVRTGATQMPQEGISVLWDLESGGATLVGSTTASTDSTGSVRIGVQLGSVPAEVIVRATLADQPSAWAIFTVHSVEPPVLSDLSPASAAAGDTVTLTGTNFSPVPGQNVVLFSGIRGRVLSATGTRLDVEVPRCLPSRPVTVSVQLGTVASGIAPLTVTGGGQVTSLPVGSPLDVADDGGFPCHALEGGAGIRYLTLVYSASTVGAAMHPYELTALSSSSPAAAVSSRTATQPTSPRTHQVDPQALWDERVRALEADLVSAARRRSQSRPAQTSGGPAAVPTVGESLVFNVLNSARDFDQVTAVARYVGAKAAIFVDQAAPTGGFDITDLEALSDRFDSVIHPEVTAAYGGPSDLDANERVIILFTPAVNRLTSPGSPGFVGGFFFGNDLLTGTTGSNGAEVFYALVPDPAGEFGDPRTKSQVLSVVPAILAHEFQHMVNFNQRFLGLDGGQEALWLAEGLAQMAEEIVARRYEELGDPASTELFRSGTRARARRYLGAPDTVSVIVSIGQGSLEERGAAYLLLLYLADQEGIEVLGRLAATTRTGVANVEAEVGLDWPDILANWWSAILLDGPGPESGPLVYPTVNLRALLQGQFLIQGIPIGGGGARPSGLLWSSSAAYYIVSPDSNGSIAVRLGGEAGGASSPQAVMRMRIIRLQ